VTRLTPATQAHWPGGGPLGARSPLEFTLDTSRDWRAIAAVVALAVSAPFLIPLAWWVPGLAAWLVSATLSFRHPLRVFRLRMGVLLGSVLVLSIVPIGTEFSNTNFLRIGLAFCAVAAGPYAILRRWDPGLIEYTLWPRRWQATEVLYALTSIPLAWFVVGWYFFTATPEMPLQWPIVHTSPVSQIWRLFFGINSVGIWDELFFINTVYAVLRSLFSPRLANLVQAVVYTSVLNDMAFIGIGPVLIYIFALIQGTVYERTRALVYVLFVHLVVDAFLIKAILHYHQPLVVPFHF
jgi:hypothetical protein